MMRAIVGREGPRVNANVQGPVGRQRRPFAWPSRRHAPTGMASQAFTRRVDQPRFSGNVLQKEQVAHPVHHELLRLAPPQDSREVVRLDGHGECLDSVCT
jgi:hypothetical protein